MAAFERRGLTAGEIAMGRSMFADELDYGAVRILQSPFGFFGAMAPLRHDIVFGAWRAARDFAEAPLFDRGWFVHELAHVWQAARGVILPLAKLRAIGGRAYRYELAPGRRFVDYNIEQQAEIARHLYLARLGAPPEGAPDRAALEAIWPLQGRAPLV